MKALGGAVTLHINSFDVGCLPEGLRRFVQDFFQPGTHEGVSVHTAMLLPCDIGSGTFRGIGSWRWLDKADYRVGLPHGVSPEEFIMTESSPFVIIALHTRESNGS